MQCSRCTLRLVAAPSDECEISIGKVNPRLRRRRRRPTIVIVSAMCHLPGDTQGGTESGSREQRGHATLASNVRPFGQQVHHRMMHYVLGVLLVRAIKLRSVFIDAVS